MKTTLPKILYVGPGTPELKTIQRFDFEERTLCVKHVPDEKELTKTLVEFRPDAIVTIGKSDREFPKLFNETHEVRKRWFNTETVTEDLGQRAYFCAMNQILTQNNARTISFFTSMYKTGKKLLRTYASLVSQIHKDWEWVLVHDSDDEETLEIAKKIVKDDHRVRVYNFEEKSGGNIGEAKYRAAMLCKGFILAELDHDDILTDTCALDLYNAALKYPDVGFFFTDWVEVNEQFQSLTYGPGFAFGYGKYRREDYKGNIWDVCDQHNINPKTIRHIVGIPNHIRAWRKSFYLSIGGHNRDMTIADDYELVVRSFLYTKFCKICRLGYIQIIYQNEQERNSHDVARADIQRRVASIAEFYNESIANRFMQLKITDWVYEQKDKDLDEIPNKFGTEEGVANYIYKPNI